MRITLFADRETSAGEFERRVMLQLLCDLETLVAVQGIAFEAVAAIEGAAPLNARGRPAPAVAH